jgi:hypothetical protein
MRVLKTTIVVCALTFVLGAGPSYAQTPPPTSPPAQPPAGQQQPPATPPAATQPAPPAPRPFPEGAKIAYIDLQRIAQASAEGKAAAIKIQEYEKKKLGEIQEKNKALEDMRKKLEQGGTVLSEAARAQTEKDIDRNTRELQFLQNAISSSGS